jgi:parvulin-like peptidyl-prolyl isomerase
MKPRVLISIVAALLCSCWIAPSAQAQEASAPVARVNGEVITHSELVKRLIADYGNAILEQLITELLVAQEAKRLGIEVAEKDVDLRIRQQIAQLPAGMTLEQALSKQTPPMSVTTYREMIRMLLRLEKMVEKDKTVVVTNNEVVQYLSNNPELTQQPEQVRLEGIVIRDQVLADKLYNEAARRNQNLQKLAQVYGTREQPVDYVELGWQKVSVVPDMPPNPPKGFVTKPQEATPGIYWIYRVMDKQAGRRKSQKEAENDARAALMEVRIAKAASDRLERIRKEGNVQQTWTKGS